MSTRVVLCLPFLFACSGGGTGAEETPSPPAVVRCVAVQVQEVRDVIHLRGVVAPQPNASATLSPVVAGLLGRVLVSEGQVVAAGELLAVVQDPTLSAGKIAANANAASAIAEEESAALEMVRQDRLAADGLGIPREREAAMARLATAKAARLAAGGQQTLAGRQLASAMLRAPYAGTVLRVLRQTGDSVDGTPATPVVIVADLSKLQLRTLAPAATAAALTIGDTANITYDSGQDTTGTVVAISPSVNSDSGLADVWLSTPSSSVARLVGVGGVANIVTVVRRSPSIPGSALRRSAMGLDEVVVCAGNPIASTELRTVEVGTIAENGTAEIRQGLAEGERIVADKVIGLEDSQAIVSGAL